MSRWEDRGVAHQIALEWAKRSAAQNLGSIRVQGLGARQPKMPSLAGPSASPKGLYEPPRPVRRSTDDEMSRNVFKALRPTKPTMHPRPVKMPGSALPKLPKPPAIKVSAPPLPTGQLVPAFFKGVRGFVTYPFRTRMGRIIGGGALAAGGLGLGAYGVARGIRTLEKMPAQPSSTDLAREDLFRTYWQAPPTY